MPRRADEGPLTDEQIRAMGFEPTAITPEGHVGLLARKRAAFAKHVLFPSEAQ